MSSGEDSETAEWEREQMLRGTQSRRQRCQQHPSAESRLESDKPKIDISTAKQLINQDIDRSQASIESIKRDIGATRRNIALSEKSLNNYRKKIEEIKSLNTFIVQLGTLKEPGDVLSYLNKNKSLIQKLSRDQLEMIDILENNAKNLLQNAMDVDSPVE